jgi:hypothetical protein
VRIIAPIVAATNTALTSLAFHFIRIYLLVPPCRFVSPRVRDRTRPAARTRHTERHDGGKRAARLYHDSAPSMYTPRISRP